MRLLRSIVRTVFVALLLAGWGLALAAVHVVRLSGGQVGVVPKDRLGLADTYVDVRDWTPADAARHPAFVKRLLAAGKTDWLGTTVGVPADELDAKLNDLVQAATPPPTTRPAKSRVKANAKGSH